LAAAESGGQILRTRVLSPSLATEGRGLQLAMAAANPASTGPHCSSICLWGAEGRGRVGKGRRRGVRRHQAGSVRGRGQERRSQQKYVVLFFGGAGAQFPRSASTLRWARLARSARVGPVPSTTSNISLPPVSIGHPTLGLFSLLRHCGSCRRGGIHNQHC
jgi:hypothetical protein